MKIKKNTYNPLSRFQTQVTPRKPAHKMWRRLTWLLCAVVLYAAYSYLGGSSGLIQYLRLLQRRSQTEQALITLQARQDSLHQVIRSLQTDTTYIEKVARERYFMGKPGEKIYSVVKTPRTDNSKK